MMADVAIAGVGMSPFGKHVGAGLRTMSLAAADAAVRSAGLTYGDIQRVYFGNAIAGTVVQQDMIKAIYTSYLGRIETSKWHGSQRIHQQPAWAAAIRADTRWRAMRYATRVGAEHGLYPIAVEVDAWIYRLPADVDPAVLDEQSPQNGKYRVKHVTGGGEP